MTNVSKFPSPIERALKSTGLSIDQINEGLAAFDQGRGERIAVLMAMEVHTLRYMWDNVGDNSFYEGPEGSHDCAEIWMALGAKGDGEYCAV